jgi:hypothetical protein
MPLDGDLSELDERLGRRPELFEGFLGLLQSEAIWDLGNCQGIIGDPEYSRRFCVTAQGRLGVVPCNTRDGDIVAVLYGAQVPFIIRPKKSAKEIQYELVGECYIHGLMDGEAFMLGLPVKELEFV